MKHSCFSVWQEDSLHEEPSECTNIADCCTTCSLTYQYFNCRVHCLLGQSYSTWATVACHHVSDIIFTRALTRVDVICLTAAQKLSLCKKHRYITTGAGAMNSVISHQWYKTPPNKLEISVVTSLESSFPLYVAMLQMQIHADTWYLKWLMTFPNDINKMKILFKSFSKEMKPLVFVMSYLWWLLGHRERRFVLLNVRVFE